MLNRLQRNKDEAKKYDAAWKVAYTIKDLGKGLISSEEMYAVAYTAYLAEENGIVSDSELKTFIRKNCSETRKLFLNDLVKYDLSLEIAKAFDKEMIKSYLCAYPNLDSKKGLERTPDYITELALRILNPQKGEELADFGSGTGSFAIAASEDIEDKAIHGIELNSKAYEIAIIRSELYRKDIDWQLMDMFALDSDMKYDRIFSNYPFGLRIPGLSQAGHRYADNMYKRMQDVRRISSSDWIYHSLIIDHLKEGGKAVAIAANGSTWNGMDQKIREYFVKKGLLEAVISMPSKMFEGTAIPTTLYVFSYNNESIRMIDARKICEQGRRQNTLSEDHIEEIVCLLETDSDISKRVTLKELEHNEYVLNSDRYLDYHVEIENGVPFGSLMKRITRGAPLKASELDVMVSEEATNIQYLMLGNIQNGMISDELPYLKELDTRLEKYCIRDQNLLMSKNGAPFKVAVAKVDADKKVLANGNLFVIELDEERVNPYFLKAFFESNKGTALLSTIAVGASIPNISTESLKKLMVPLPSIEKQNTIADMYKAKEDEIKILQLRLQRAQSDLKGIFEEVD